MMSKAEVMKHLSAVATGELLRLLRDDTIFEIAGQYFASIGLSLGQNETESLVAMDQSSTVLFTEPAKAASVDRAKRPLNAFMAFRSYYLKIFPEVQQKTASGFLTTLWNKDPFRNKWALIAKVYSFVRDQLGRDKVSLSHFLSVSCPIMKIIEPSVYLSSFCWCVTDDETGSPKLLHDDTGVNNFLSSSQSEDCPNTENELLAAILDIGYFSDESTGLMERMSTNSSRIMTTVNNSLSVPCTKEKLNFMKTIQDDPLQAAKSLLGSHYDEQQVSIFGIKAYRAEDLSSLSHLPMEIAHPDPRQYYNYSTSSALQYQDDASTLQLHGLENNIYDIDNPWHVDKLMGYNEPEGERTAGLPPSAPYNAHDDFYYAF